ncbi:MAG: UbiH/UbiF family hydroxylase [Xanthobacteraceae bacterium]
MNGTSFEVVVVGGGPAGLTAAVAMAGARIRTCLVSRHSVADNRTTALLAGSVQALDVIGLWEQCRSHAAPLRSIRVIDATTRLLRGPEICFSAEEIGLHAFGHNIENRHLLSALQARARELPALSLMDDEAEAVELGELQVAVTLRRWEAVSARLVIGADGRHSRMRLAAGIEIDPRSYPQSALTFNVRHRRDHHGTATELHTETGPFTLVPLPGKRSSLVWVTTPEQGARLVNLEDARLAEEVERQSHSILGAVEIEPGRSLFPLGVATARRLSTHRLVLIGEAAHLTPPIGAQGLNLGLRDAATIAELTVAAHRVGEDVGSAALTARYAAMRRADVTSRIMAVDLLNRSLLSDLLPVQGLRGLALYLLDRIGPLRRALMREGVVPSSAQPRLMQGLPL